MAPSFRPGKGRSPREDDDFFEAKGDRKTRKPLVEKKRRARINESLQELRLLLADSEFQAKLENAEVLELTVRRVQAVLEGRSRAAPASTPPRPPSCSTTCWSPCPSTRAPSRTSSRTLWPSPRWGRARGPGPAARRWPRRPRPPWAWRCPPRRSRPPPARRPAPTRRRRRLSPARPRRTGWTLPGRAACLPLAFPNPCGDPGNGGAEGNQRRPT
ncbi:transcription factor HES-2-like isoform X4 [Dromaius novaehollandiae]|uniref:transcription factor HES-2-like isoform X4 n=1 Tax=Dromaius novaehollandiae TaxID=8790 RepID=UPI00311D87D1